MLLTTQYLDEADRLADTIVVIDHGLDDRRRAPRTSSRTASAASGSRSRLEDGASFEDAVRALEPMADDRPSCERGLVTMNVRQRHGTIVEAVRRLSDAGVEVDDLALRRPTLDDVFLTLTGHAAEEPSPTRTRTEGGRVSQAA